MMLIVLYANNPHHSFCIACLCLSQIDSLSRVNHKNFVNLLGYCEENKPFTRMMVFEYAPNGTLFEHLHGRIKPEISSDNTFCHKVETS